MEKGSFHNFHYFCATFHLLLHPLPLHPHHRTYRSLGIVLANQMNRPPQEVKGLTRCK